MQSTKMKTCPRCKGEGLIRAKADKPYPKKTCPQCMGKGWCADYQTK